jgi:hypothetical protein
MSSAWRRRLQPGVGRIRAAWSDSTPRMSRMTLGRLHAEARAVPSGIIFRGFPRAAYGVLARSVWAVTIRVRYFCQICRTTR